MQYGSNNYPNESYFKLVKALQKMIPFYHYYFNHYSLQKKAVVLATFYRLKIYDEELYSSFVRGLDAVVSSAS